MAQNILFKRGNTTQVAAHTGALGSIVIDTQANRIHIQDGITAGGMALVNTTDLASKVSTSLLGAANGVATLDASGLVPTSQLPSYVDDVLEFADLASFPASGDSGKIFVAIDTGKIYRWSGTVYVEISSAATADTALKLQTARNITASGDASWTVSFDGSADVTADLTLSASGVAAGTYNASATETQSITVDSKGRVTAVGTLTKITPDFADITGKPTTLAGYGITDAVNTSQLGANNGVATLDANGKLTATQLPSAAIEVIEAANLAAFPGTGEIAKVYVAKDTNKIYRWDGTSAYVELSSTANLAVVDNNAVDIITVSGSEITVRDVSASDAEAVAATVTDKFVSPFQVKKFVQEGDYTIDLGTL